MRQEFWRFTEVGTEGEEHLSILQLEVQEESVVMMRYFAAQMALDVPPPTGEGLQDAVVVVSYEALREILVRDGGTYFETEEEARA